MRCIFPQASNKKSSPSFDNEDNHPYCYVKTHYWIRTVLFKDKGCTRTDRARVFARK